MAEQIDRSSLKAQMKALLRDAQVSPKIMTALYLGIVLVLNTTDTLVDSSTTGAMLSNSLALFVSILSSLLGYMLSVGFILYCMAVRRNERAEFLTLFDGFSFAGKIIGLMMAEWFFVFLWSMLFVVPGIIALYRYRFAVMDLCENPWMGVMEALDMSKRQTAGYKTQLMMLDLSYLGWGLLASLPSIYFTYQETSAALTSLYSGTGFAAISVVPHSALEAAVAGLWSLAVSLFYLPVYQCTEIGYYEVAKTTSGLSPNNPLPPHDDRDEDGDGSFF